MKQNRKQHEDEKGGCKEKHYIFIFCPLSDSITAGEEEGEGETLSDTGSGGV